MIWTESEIEMFTTINNSYNETIITDLQTYDNLFVTYLKRDKDRVAEYRLTPSGDLDWEFMDDKMLVWRKTSLDRPVQVYGFRNPDILLGLPFKQHLDKKFNEIFDSGDAEVYL